ncbi:MAG: 5'-3' exonuclease H3TH domain-containing protein [Acidimicrobiales bacterium]|jgi:5'-3' exonuclease|nr:flap endonuclease [Acidimicrobiaceae bacterium]MDP6161284.1 5'-3' exonuclease H3TH domain-containing protein [Acidimicrobiales bacterium]HJL91032.1 5'-3' exonuclease H3TH domain-containing protein [Acidimicrobiales bacterium]HJO40272.1 5'-3' exonuclease H3TH domain-containing protein [Acidimicrobiales bacterium]|tara:strand:+ start:52 stop:924 length:873 start_codon:yes stop_codon:yes gene_type:complete
MEIHLVDGTYELFRHYFAVPSHKTSEGVEVAATRGVLGTLVRLLEDGATHVGVATDHVIESFRNDLFDGYKTGEGTPPEIMSQFPLVEALIEAAGFITFPMIEFEADDALASAARIAKEDPSVKRILICSPDKDLAQCVTDDGRVVQFDRRQEIIYDATGVREKFGVSPSSIPDFLALVGDSADGIPGLPGWGAKSSSLLLASYGTIEKIPLDPNKWDVPVRGAEKLAETLSQNFKKAQLYKDLTILRDNVSVMSNVSELEWVAPKEYFTELCDRLDASKLAERLKNFSR